MEHYIEVSIHAQADTPGEPDIFIKSLKISSTDWLETNGLFDDIQNLLESQGF